MATQVTDQRKSRQITVNGTGHRHADALEEQEARLDERDLVALLEAEARADDVHVGAAGAPERPHDAAAGVGALSPARSADARVC